MKRLDLKAPPTNKQAVGYKVTDGDKYPIIGFLYQYKDITKLATIGVDESVTEAKNDGNLDTIADYVQQVLDDGKSFMDIGKKLKGAYKYDFSTGMMPMYIIPVSGNQSKY